MVISAKHNKSLTPMDGEVWTSWPVCEHYMVSNFGRVKSSERVVPHDYKGSVLVSEKILSQSYNGVGYLVVTVSINKIKKHRYVHRMVGETYLDNPMNKPQINHKNGVRDDNVIDNLEWATNSENNLHSFRELGRVSAKSMLGKFGSKHFASKVVYCPTLNIYFESARIAGRELGLSQGSISHVCNGNRNYVDGLNFRYA